MDNTFYGSQRPMQPQTNESAPRAANPGTGMGNRSYAPGIMQGMSGGDGPFPPAGAVAPPSAPGQTDPYRMSDTPTGGNSPMSSAPPAAVPTGAADPSMIMMQARAKAQELIDHLIARHRATSGSGGY